jgi:hypothetical protein
MGKSRFTAIVFGAGLTLLATALLCPLAVAEERFKKDTKPKPVKEEPPDFDLRSVQDVDLQAAWDREAKTRWSSPSLGVSVPGAFGADWGFLYGGL